MISMEDVINGFVVGIVDNYGAVHSKFISLDDSHKGISHGDLFPGRLLRWRWDYRSGLRSGLGCGSEEIDNEAWAHIREHLTREYRIPWQSNKWHDWEKMEEEATK